jgi:hypothetical protein
MTAKVWARKGRRLAVVVVVPIALFNAGPALASGTFKAVARTTLTLTARPGC